MKVFSEAKRRIERWKQGCITQFKLPEMPVINSCFMYLNIRICQVSTVDFFGIGKINLMSGLR